VQLVTSRGGLSNGRHRQLGRLGSGTARAVGASTKGAYSHFAAKLLSMNEKTQGAMAVR